MGTRKQILTWHVFFHNISIHIHADASLEFQLLHVHFKNNKILSFFRSYRLLISIFDDIRSIFRFIFCEEILELKE